MANANQNLKGKRNKRVWNGFVRVLAAIVVFCTTYALIIPAITWERMLICELEEHTHTAECYTDGVLTCSKIEHVHTDACFDAPAALVNPYICGKIAHTHTEDCYYSDGTLKCTIPEHEHTLFCSREYRLTNAKLLAAAPQGADWDELLLADPDTSDLLSLFKINGKFSGVFDGKVAVDKTVKVNEETSNFDVTLSALGQSYNSQISESEMIHPDVVFVVDISYSMVQYNMSGSGSGKRLKGVADALNKAIDELLKNDPETRIGIVSYSINVWDGTSGNDKRLYLPFDKYKALSGANYVSYTTSGSYKIGFNTNWQNADGKKVSATTATIGSSDYGTFTEGGLFAGMQMLQDAPNKDKREPVLILISDGLPTYYQPLTFNSTTGKATRGTKDGSATNDPVPVADYWTIRTAMYAKQQIKKSYDDAQQSGEPVGCLFYSLGPGVTSLEGQTVLSPGSEYGDTGKTNLQACEEAATTNAAHTLYTYLMNGNGSAMPALSEEELAYVDFADWSLSGELTPSELEEAMRNIINSFKQIPRPIITTVTTDVAEDVIDPDSFVTFIDTIGDRMKVYGQPRLNYNGTTRESSSKHTGTVASGDYAGCAYTMYQFVGSDVESSTGHIANFSDIRVYVIDREDGTQVVVWQFPASLLPIIYHDYGETAADSDDRFYDNEPIRLTFTVDVDGVTAEPGYVYHTNSVDEPTYVHFDASEDNPYALEHKFPSTTVKTENVTETLANSSEYSESYTDDDNYMTVILGNNGVLKKNNFEMGVQKVWTGGTPSDISSITVELFANGVSTGETRTLNNANNWTESFGAKIAFDVDGNPIEYVIKETALADYYLESVVKDTVIRTDHNLIKEGYTEPEHWELGVNGLADGGIYRIRSGNTVLRMNRSGSKPSNYTYSLTTATVSNTNLETDFTSDHQWQFTKDGNYWKISSVEYSGSGINRSGNAFSANTSLTSLSINATTGVVSSGTNHYFRINGDGFHTSSSSNATHLTFDRYYPANTIEPDYEDVDVTVTTFVLTNTPLPDSIEAEKVWGDRTAGNRVPVTLALYEKDGNTVTRVNSITLDSDSDWKGEIDLTSCDNRKTYYVAEDDLPSFLATYPGAETETIVYQGKNITAMKITFGETAKVKVKNDCYPRLPSTGGSGTTVLYTIGASLIVGALVCGYVLRRRNKRRKEATL